MNCPICDIELTGTVCPNCGRKYKEGKDHKIRFRREYNGTVYGILAIFLDALLLGIADLYAGYIKMACVKLALSILGVVLLIVTGSFFFGALACVSVLISVFELIKFAKKPYLLNNEEASIVWVRPLDLIYDRTGTENLVMAKYGCTLKILAEKRKSRV